MAPVPRILLIDDDAALSDLLVEYLRRQGMRCDVCRSGETALEKDPGSHYDAIILDVMLPGIDGFAVLRKLRRDSSCPVLMLTARGEDIDRIIGLELGADDYLPKPFNPRELVARVRAILRRAAAPRSEDSRLSVGGVTADSATREAWRDGSALMLTAMEFDLLWLFLLNAGRVLTRDAILGHFNGRRASPFDRAIDLHVSHLRRKLGPGPALIKTVRSVGYQFVRDTGEEPA
jgi:two-component system response regulator CpxR